MARAQFKVARVEFNSPADAKVDINDGNFKSLLVQPTAECAAHWSKQFGSYQAEFDQDPANAGKEMRKRADHLLPDRKTWLPLC